MFIETTFRLVYGIDVMVPIEVGEIWIRRQNFMEAKNNEALQVNLYLIEQVQEDVIIMI